MLLVSALFPKTVTSPANPRLKEIRRAIERGTRTRDGYLVAEGPHLLEEALASRCEIGDVFAAASAQDRAPAGVPLTVLPDALFRSIASTETSQGLLALVRAPEWPLERLFAGQALVVVVDGVQDPGNLGAIFRAAEAFAATGVILVKGTVDPHNPKAVRASAGSLFRMPLATGFEPAAALEALAAHSLAVFAALPGGGASASESDLRQPCALLIGSEGAGIGVELRAGAKPLTIPVRGVESLNAAMAAGILLYEARRQRSGP